MRGASPNHTHQLPPPLPLKRGNIRALNRIRSLTFSVGLHFSTTSFCRPPGLINCRPLHKRRESKNYGYRALLAKRLQVRVKERSFKMSTATALTVLKRSKSNANRPKKLCSWNDESMLGAMNNLTVQIKAF